MSEQMNAKELWSNMVNTYAKIEGCRPGGHDITENTSLGDDACMALILADRKATVERIMAVLTSHTNQDPHGYVKADGSSDGIIICTDALRAALKAALKDMGVVE